MSGPATTDLRRRLQQLEARIGELERCPDSATRTLAQDVTQTLLDLHAAGLTRLLGLLARSGEPARAVIEDAARDDLIGSLLLLYGLHPHSISDRVRLALDQVRPHVQAWSGVLELRSVVGGVVRLGFRPSPPASLRALVEAAIYDAAPDVAGIEVIEEEEPPSRRVSLPLVGATR